MNIADLTMSFTLHCCLQMNVSTVNLNLSVLSNGSGSGGYADDVFSDKENSSPNHRQAAFVLLSIRKEYSRKYSSGFHGNQKTFIRSDLHFLRPLDPDSQ